MQGPVTGAERAAEDEEAVLDQPVHERRMLVPAVLAADRAGGIPARAVHQRHRESGHAATVPAGTDSQSGEQASGPAGHPGQHWHIPG
jgi:hypothetical protein